MDPQKIWEETVKYVKEKKFFLPLWQAMEAVVPITIEEDYIVLGFHTGTYHLRKHLEEGTNRLLIEEALRKAAGKPLTIKIIEATTYEEWLAIKERERGMEIVEEVELARRKGTTGILRQWDEFSSEIYRRYLALDQKSLPQTKAAFLLDVLPDIVAKRRELYSQEAPPYETNEKAFARLLDKLAYWTGIPSALLAWEILKRERREG